MSVTAAIVRTAAALEALEPAWWELWRRARTATPFQSPAWLVPWWRAFHPGELVTAVAWKDRRLVGLAPFYREDGPFGRRLLPVGISLSDYHDVLLDEADAEEAAAALMAAFDADGSWDALECEELPPGAAVLRLPVPPGCAETLSVQSACPVLALPGPDLMRFLPGQTRRKLNLARNRAARRGGFRIARAGGADLPEAFAELARLHALRWQARGEGGLLADERVPAFHAEALPRLDAAGVLRLYILRLDGAAAAAFYGFSHRGRGYSYLTGFDPAFAFESPGALLLAHAVEEAIAEGAQEFHFLRGREAYKYEWGAVDRLNRRRSLRRAVPEQSVA
ncbi:MAG TPA: GNAT family N-acetyltransferase [Beijerinckiaceae bacterium]|jgi:CelD/BcsL family acetyltransferase involved in cellulose biosynthesis